MTTKTKPTIDLAPRQTFRATIDRVDFSGTEPMHRPVLDTKRDIPQTTYRPGSLEAFNLPSRGFA
ncbi:hypothetical protein [Hydrogenophaga sp.]|uniref:hypothetical protein n=1 Tax=Hydrogenophaga sp. TaxID=1904254 RepID=UPI0035B3A616